MHVLRKLAFCLVAIWLTACTQAPTEPLRIVSSPWAGYEPLYLARDLGYLNEASVRITELPSANITLEAFRNGSADVATLTLDETVTLLAQGRKLRILLVMDVSNGADAIVAKPTIKTLADLKGKRIGMENIPLGVYILNRFLDISGLANSDVTVIPMPEDKHEKAYQKGAIDAAITMEPYKTRLTRLGAKVLLDSSRIPDEIFDLLVVREEVYQARRDELCRLSNQWFRALDYVRANPREAAERMSKRMGVDAATFQASMDGIKVPNKLDNQRLLGGKTPTLLAPAGRLVELMQRAHMLPGAVDVAAAIGSDVEACLQ